MGVYKILNDGISIENDNIILNTNNDLDTDIIHIMHPEIYKSEFIGNTYHFGYRFEDSTSRKHRSMVIKWLKGLGSNTIDNKSLQKLVRKPLLELGKQEDLFSFDCLLYPRSSRSNLTKIIMQEIYKLTSHDLERCSFELVKTLPNSVKFDWKSFNANYEGDIGDNTYEQIHNYVNDVLLPKIHDLSYFSIADNVKYKYRPYIQDYLTFPNEEQKNLINAINNGKILIVDDINTSGSTLTEILRLVRSINHSCSIYIFTLIGKD